MPTMWGRVNRPDLLVYLDAELPAIAQRSSDHWEESYLEQLRHRLRHAREHCDFYVATDDLTEDEVLDLVVRFLHSRSVKNT